MSSELQLVERIRAEASRIGKSIAWLEREAGLGNGTIRKWNNNIPSVEKLARISDILGKSIDYLYYGHEERPMLDDDESELIDLYRTVPPNIQERFYGYMKGLSDATEFTTRATVSHRDRTDDDTAAAKEDVSGQDVDKTAFQTG